MFLLGEPDGEKFYLMKGNNISYNTSSSTWQFVPQPTFNKNNQQKIKQALGLKYKPFIFLNHTFEESKITSGRKVYN